MAVKVAINGFGRIGRLVARAILERPDCGLELVAINDLADAKSNAMLFKRDSVHGAYPGTVTADGNDIIIDGKRIHVTAERDPANLPHAANNVDIALECTGFFTDRESAQKHLDAGAKRVLISAPAKGVDLTVVFGVNHDKLKPEHTIVSNASCTTNCLAPVAKVLNDAIVEDLGHRCQAIGRARCVRHDGVFTGQLVVVDAEHNSQVHTLGRRRDQHALGTRIEVLLRGLAVREKPCEIGRAHV